MPVLREKTRIKTGWNNIPATAPWRLSSSYGFNQEQFQDYDNLLIGAASTRLIFSGNFPELSQEGQKILNKLKSFLTLPDDWDGAGATPPCEEVINKVIDFLQKADEYDLPADFTAPGPNGEVLLEYRQEGFSAEVYFEGGVKTEMILYQDKDQKYVGTLDINKLLEHFSIVPVC